jgi:hypothetical protein
MDEYHSEQKLLKPLLQTTLMMSAWLPCLLQYMTAYFFQATDQSVKR